MTFKVLVVKADARALDGTCEMLSAISAEHADPSRAAALEPFLEVHRASSGEDAWELAMATDFDLAVVDEEAPPRPPALHSAPRRARSAPAPPHSCPASAGSSSCGATRST